MYVYTDIEQGSQEWHNLRSWRATASEFDKIITPAKGELSKSALSYMRSLARKYCITDPKDAVDQEKLDKNWSIQWGKQYEPIARDWFREHTGLNIVEVSFVVRGEDDLGPIGCSPDSMIIDANGDYVAGLEIKCPCADTHVEYLLDAKLPNKYKLQVHGGMAVTGLDAWHFVSYFPKLKPLHIIIERDDYTERLSDALDQFAEAYAQEYDKVHALVEWVTDELKGGQK